MELHELAEFDVEVGIGHLPEHHGPSCSPQVGRHHVVGDIGRKRRHVRPVSELQVRLQYALVPSRRQVVGVLAPQAALLVGTQLAVIHAGLTSPGAVVGVGGGRAFLVAFAAEEEKAGCADLAFVGVGVALGAVGAVLRDAGAPVEEVGRTDALSASGGVGAGVAVHPAWLALAGGRVGEEGAGAFLYALAGVEEGGGLTLSTSPVVGAGAAGSRAV